MNGGGPRPEPPLVYLDHAATAPLRPEVVEAMAPYLGPRFGNPSGAHRMARQARRAVDDARQLVAEFLGADPGEVVFTGGGTEADNLAVLGSLAARVEGSARAGVVVCSAVEHAAVLETCRAATRPGVAVTGVAPVALRLAPVGPSGLVDLGALAELLDDQVCLVSIMLANNEVGTIQPLADVARLMRQRSPGARLHTDAVQAAPYLDLAAEAAEADLVSISAHKLGGPKGVGALVARRGVPLAPVVHGGGQERDLRSGTHNVAGVVGLAAACRVVADHRAGETDRVAALRDRLADGVRAAVPGVVESVERSSALPGHCHLRFPGLDQEELVVLLDDHGVCASAGAACASGAVEPSHVLAAMGVAPDAARSAVRFSLGWTTGAEDVSRALGVIPTVVGRLRGDE
jgi:cysteine desulfurase